MRRLVPFYAIICEKRKSIGSESQALHPTCVLPAKVSMTVDEAHSGGRCVSPINDADCSGIEEDTQGRRNRCSKCSAEQHFNWPYMGNEHNRLVRVCLAQAFDCSANTLLHRLKAFSPWRREGSVLFPFLQSPGIFRATCFDFSMAQPFPCPKITFTQIIHCLYIEHMLSRYW